MNEAQKITLNNEELFDDYNYSYNNYSYNSNGEGAVCSQESSMYFDSIFIPVLYSLALVVGLVGNGLVLAVLWKKRKSLNVTDIFILHLSLADLLLLLTLPFWAVEAVQGWIFGTVLCKLTGALFKINFYCGIFMLSCISLDRYLSIVHAMQMYSRKKPVATHCCCLMVWFFCLLLSIPDWIFLVATEDSRRQDKTECVPFFPSDSWHLATRLLYHILGFILPALMILFCYYHILQRLQHGSQCKQKKRAIRVIVTLVLAFFISWTPYNITLIVDTIQTNKTISLNTQISCESATALDVALTATATLGYLHCCVNPVLYAFVGVKFRQHLLDILKPLGFTLMGPVVPVSRKSSLWTESVDTSHTSAF
ncbi:C-X-C chemokine receptor type 3-like [Carassius auratus]|uniref:C-X-C chemokine receptor type 3 n=1 Tax=Carassius auratus TaxID=7957 RepID=A0A6P6LIR1_CARAU|nr:C-X-C chemokine receptor type 3-like [Carassius auratus]XP_026084488.1 C-X-C chemokine receptor type 3-like [Carassius auratus]XP_026084489.1 C-X-C chemokine receptor type 3-like [Carassius auratus]